MNKALLVALREYMENLRTKAFWIGIMAFPVILVLAFSIPVFLEKRKDVRHYAVMDKSGWLLEEVERLSVMPDLENVLTEAFEHYEKKSEDFDGFPMEIRELTKVLSTEIDKEAGKAPGEEAAPEKREEWEKKRDQFKVEKIHQKAELLTEISALITEEKKETDQKEFDEQFKKPVQAWYAELSPEEAKKFGSGLSRSRYARLDVDLSGKDPEAKLKKMLGDEKIFAYFIIGANPEGMVPKPEESPDGIETGGAEDGLEKGADSVSKEDALAGEADAFCKYVSKNLTDSDWRNWFSRYANQAVRTKRIENAKIQKNMADWIQKTVVFESKRLSDEGEEEEVGMEDKVRQWAPVAFVYLLWISIFTITQMLLTNTIEEKSNKIMEVLLSSVSPLQLMAGKIIGIAGTGLTMVISWVLFFLAAIKFLPQFLGDTPGFDLSLIVRDPIYLGSFLAYFILGYLLLSAILVGIGSVCNSLKEAQNLMAPVTIILIVPLLAMFPIGKDPNGTIAKVLSYFPPFTPFVMMNRAAGPPSTMEYVITTVLLVISIVVALWAAAKVFRVGILMTGKPPKIFEILKWIRAPVGHVSVRKE